MRKRTAALIVLGAITPGVAGVALATPPTPDGALKSELLARGAAGEFRIHDESMRVPDRRSALRAHPAPLELHQARPLPLAVTPLGTDVPHRQRKGPFVPSSTPSD